MNKLTKASIAGAAGIALLLGGAGTFALWNDSAALDDSSITSGTLDITDTSGTWSETHTLWVPGNTATFTGTVTFVATGDDLAATLSVDTTDLLAGNDLANALDVTFVATGAGISSGSGGVYNVTVGAGSHTADVTVTVEFDEDTSGTTAQNMSVDLDSIDFVLQQIAIAP